MSRFVRRTPVLEAPGPDYRAIKARFFAINRERLQRARTELRSAERDFLDLLPLLFHVNHPGLPGYVDKATPAGVPEYSPDGAILRLARRHFRSFAWRKRAYRRFEVQSLFMMGSTGTIAFSDQSDFDIWVCHADDLAPEQVKRLEVKAAAIEQWARAKGVEANLFLVAPRAFREGRHGELGSENTGSALHYLLLEEFYRTSVLLAGRYPLWWLVPPDEEGDYDRIAADIKRKRLVHAREHIDLGGLHQVTADEFYGATLWLLYKSIHAPYKSLLKILLMEAYATEYPALDLLGMRFKRAVYAGEDDIDRLDPYCMMLEKVEEFLTRAGDVERRDLARRSFYFKVGIKLSERGDGGWRRALLQALVDRWGWHHSQLVRLDRRERWKLNAVLEERQRLIREFTQTYRYLSLFARTKSDVLAIAAEDLDVLGRKLYAAFERKAGKIDIVYQGITPDLHESHVSFHELTNADGRRHWMVFSGVVPESAVSLHSPLRRGYSLMELLAWCYFNRVIDRRTVIALYSANPDLDERELVQIVEQLGRIFPDALLTAPSIEDMRRPERVLAMTTVINLGLDPFGARSRRGEHLTSNQTDALKYGGRLENLALSIDQILVTSWQQVLATRYSGAKGLMQCIRDVMRWAPPGGPRPPLHAMCHSSYRGPAIARRIEALFATLYAVFDPASSTPDTRFVLGIEWDYFVLWHDGREVRYAHPGELANLKRWLGRPRARHFPVIFDEESPADQVLPLIYRQDRPRLVQVFYEVRGQRVHVWILDEKGALCEQVRPLYDVVALVRQYREFFDAVLPRLHVLDANGREIVPVDEVRFYRIERDGEGRRSVLQHSLNEFMRSLPYLRLQVIVDRIDNETVYTLYCEDREFSTLEHGEGLFAAVVDHVLALRRDGEPYPLHVTDIDLSPRVLAEEEGRVQTVRYLDYKQRVEAKLQQALAARR